MTPEEKTAGLLKLRESFPPNMVSKLNRGKGVVLDYVGHAALTARLLDVDPLWFWEPMAVTATGLPAFDEAGGLWIRLTVCGMSRLGYGNAPKKGTPGDREKEVIGDALRNAAMRFGAALDLWHKGDLYAHESDAEDTGSPAQKSPQQLRAEELLRMFELAQTKEEIDEVDKLIRAEWSDIKHVEHIKDAVVASRTGALRRVKESAP